MADYSDSDDWRTKCKNVTETYAEARRRALFIDVRFVVGQQKSARYFSAHKMILACGSPVFEAMFFGQLAEKKDPIAIPDDDPEAFEVMLRYLYGETVAFTSIVVACKTHFISDKYLIPQLQAISEEYILLADMNDESFWGIIEGNLLSGKHAEKRFRSYIQENASRLLQCDEFLEVPEHIVKMILEMDSLNASELELLFSVTKWGLKKFDKDTLWKLKTLLQNIRFSTMTPKEFCLFTDKFPDVLEPLTSFKILKHLNDPNLYSLPYWCSTNKAVRSWADLPVLPLPTPNFNFPHLFPSQKRDVEKPGVFNFGIIP